MTKSSDALRGVAKPISKTTRPKRTHCSLYEKDVFEIFVNPKLNLIIPIHRKISGMPSRVKELERINFAPAEISVTVPDPHALWTAALPVMRKKKILSHWLVRNDHNNNFIKAFKLNTDMCMEELFNELNCSDVECKWLKGVANNAGRIPHSQTFINQYMAIKPDEVKKE